MASNYNVCGLAKNGAMPLMSAANPGQSLSRTIIITQYALVSLARRNRRDLIQVTIYNWINR